MVVQAPGATSSLSNAVQAFASSALKQLQMPPVLRGTEGGSSRYGVFDVISEDYLSGRPGYTTSARDGSPRPAFFSRTPEGRSLISRRETFGQRCPRKAGSWIDPGRQHRGVRRWLLLSPHALPSRWRQL